jgi:hypothetical protein
MRALFAVAAIAALAAVATGAGAGAHARARATCGAATRLRGAPILALGPLRVAGFASDHCAEIVLGCGPKSGGYQAPLSIEVSKRLASPVVLEPSPAAAAKFVLVGTTTPAPKVPRCVASSRARPTAKLRAPDMYWVLFVFAPRNASFRLTARRGGRELGSGVIIARGA